MAKLIRRVRTPGGSSYYGLPIGAIITPDIIQQAKAKHGGTAAPKGSTSIRVGSQAPSGQKPQSTKKGYEAKQSSVEAIKSILAKQDKLPQGDKGFVLGGTEHKLPEGTQVLRSASFPDRIAYVKTPDGQTFRLVDEKVEALEGDIKNSVDSIFANGGDESKFKPLTTVEEDDYLAEADPANSPYLDVEGMSIGDTLTSPNGLKTLTKTGENEWTDSVTGFKRYDATVQALVDFGSFGVGGKEVPDAIDEPTNLMDLLGDEADVDDFADYLNGLPNGQKLNYDDGTTYTKVEDGENDRWVNDADEKDELSNEEIAALAPIVELQPTPDIPENAPVTQDDEGNDLPEEEIEAPEETAPAAEATPGAPQLNPDTPLTAAQLNALPSSSRVRTDDGETWRRNADGTWRRPGLTNKLVEISTEELAEKQPKIREVSQTGAFIAPDGSKFSVYPKDGSAPYVVTKKTTNEDTQEFDLLTDDGELLVSVNDDGATLDDLMEENSIYNEPTPQEQADEQDEQDELDDYLDEQFNNELDSEDDEEPEENGMNPFVDAAELDEMPAGSKVEGNGLDEDGNVDEDNPEVVLFTKNDDGTWTGEGYATAFSSADLVDGFGVYADSISAPDGPDEEAEPEAPAEPEKTPLESAKDDKDAAELALKEAKKTGDAGAIKAAQEDFAKANLAYSKAVIADKKAAAEEASAGKSELEIAQEEFDAAQKEYDDALKTGQKGGYKQNQAKDNLAEKKSKLDEAEKNATNEEGNKSGNGDAPNPNEKNAPNTDEKDATDQDLDDLLGIPTEEELEELSDALVAEMKNKSDAPEELEGLEEWEKELLGVNDKDKDLTPDESAALESTLGDDPDNFTPDEQNPEGDPVGDDADVENPGIVEEDTADKPEATTQKAIKALQDKYIEPWMSKESLVFQKGEVTEETIDNAPVGLVLQGTYEGQVEKIVKLPNGLWFNGDEAITEENVKDLLDTKGAKLQNPNEVPGFNGIANELTSKKGKDAAKKTYGDILVEQNKGKSFSVSGKENYGKNKFAAEADKGKLVLSVNDTPLTKDEIAQAYKALNEHSSAHVTYGLQDVPQGHPLADMGLIYQLRDTALLRYPKSKPKAAALLLLKEAGGIQDAPLLHPKGKKILVGDFLDKRNNVQGPAYGFFSIDDLQDSVAILDSTKSKQFKSVLTYNLNAVGNIDPTKVTGGGKDKNENRLKYIDYLTNVLNTSALVPTKEQYVARMNGLQAGHIVLDRKGGVWTKNELGVWSKPGVDGFLSSSALFDEIGALTTFVSQKSVFPTDYPVGARLAVIEDDGSATLYKRDITGKWVKVFEDAEKGQKSEYTDAWLTSLDTREVFKFTTDNEDIIDYDPVTGEPIYYDADAEDTSLAAWANAVSEVVNDLDMAELGDVELVDENAVTDDPSYLEAKNVGTAVNVTDDEGHSTTYVKGTNGKWEEEFVQASPEMIVSASKDTRILLVNAGFDTIHLALSNGEGSVDIYDNNGKMVDNASATNPWWEDKKYLSPLFVGPVMSAEDFEDAPASTRVVMDTSPDGSMLKPSEASILVKQQDGYWYSDYGQTWAGWELDLMGRTHSLHTMPGTDATPEADLPAAKTSDDLINENGTVTVESEPISKSKDKGGMTTAQATNPEYLQENTDQPDGVKPGKYSTPNATSSYMIVHEDGTGTYYNKKGEPKKLTANAVKKNAAIMTKFHGDAEEQEKAKPEATDAEKAEYAKSLKKDISTTGEFELADGTYYSGNQNLSTGKIYEVKDGEVKAYSPLVSQTVSNGYYSSKYKLGDNIGDYSTLGKFPEGTKFKINTNSLYIKPEMHSIVSAFVEGDNLNFKDADGKVVHTLPKEGLEYATIFKDFASGNYLSMWFKLEQIGEGKIEKPKPSKNAMKKLALTGGLLDGYGNSVVPADYLGQVKFLGHSASSVDLMELKNALDTGELSLDKLNYAFGHPDDGNLIEVSTENLDDYARDFLGMTESDKSDNSKVEAFRQKAYMAMLDAVTANFSAETPNTDAMALFEKDEFGNPKKPMPTNPEEYGDISTHWGASTGQFSKYIKQISDNFGGGGIIGLHYTKMSKDDKWTWINALKSGDFAKMYKVELQAAAKEGKPHGSGFLHPGYTGNVETHQIKYGPLIPGEKLAAETIEGNWSTTAQLATAEELDNYLILATMQNPTHLSLEEKRSWVHFHRNGNQEMVDNLSEVAQARAKAGNAPLSPAPTWTDDVKPGKSYTKLFDSTPHPANWSGAQAAEYIEDHKDFHEPLMTWANQNYGGTYTKPNELGSYILAVYLNQHFQNLADIEYQKSLIPVYHVKAEQTLVKGTHPAYNVADQFGNEFIFKPRPSMTKAEKYRAEAEHAANLIGRILGFQTAKSSLVEMEVKGEQRYGQMQSVIPNVVSGMDSINLDTLTPQQIEDVATEHMLDWLLDNDDTHSANMLLNANGRLIGIDKGRAFKHYGAWKGLDPQAMNSNATTVYSLLFDRIAKGKFSKEDIDQAYLAARKRVAKMAVANDKLVQDYLAEGMKNRTAYDVKYSIDGKAVPNTYEGLLQAVMHRKAGLVDDFDKVWAGLYKKAKYGDLPEPPVSVLPNELASGLTDQSHIDKAFLSKSVGHSTFIGGANVIGGNATSWIEKGKNSETFFHSEMYLAPKAQAEMTAMLQKLVDPTTVGSANSNLTDKYLDTFINAAKTVNHHAADGEYNMPKIDAMKNMMKDIENDLEAIPTLKPSKAGLYKMPSGTQLTEADLGQYVLMSNYYLDKGDQVLKSMADKEKVKPHITGYTILTTDADKVWTHPDGSKLVSTEKGTYIHLDSSGKASILDGTDAAVVAIIAGENGWLGKAVEKKDSPYSHLKVKMNGSTYEVKSEYKDGDKVHVGGKQSGTPGNEYEILLPTGERIFYRNTDKTGSARAHQGKLTAKFETTGPEEAAIKMQHVQDTLEELGLNVTPADMTSLELSYWREQYGVLINRGGESGDSDFWAKAKKELQKKAAELGKPNELIENLNAELGNEGEVLFWREFWAKYKPDQVAKVVAEEDFLPTFKHQSIDDPTLETGKPIFMRLDWREEYEEILKTNKILTHRAYSLDHLPSWIEAGGLLSSEERLRSTGFFNAGMSSSSDQNYGSSHSLYTRIQSKGSNGWHVMLNPKAALAARTYSASSDTFGQLTTRNSSAPHEISTAFQKYSGGSNETMVPHTLSFLDDIELIVVDTAQQRDYLIQELKKRGITEIRGVPVEDRIVLPGQRKEAVEKLSKLWKENLND